MKRLILFLLGLFFAHIYAAPFENLPYRVTQPDGTTLQLYQSGDEFFNWLHDKDGYPVIQGTDGYYFYAYYDGEQYVASLHRADQSNPRALGLSSVLQVNKALIRERREAMIIPPKPVLVENRNTKNTLHTGTFNNLVIYIRFADESEIETPQHVYDQRLNQPDGYSVKAYFNEVSYNQLIIQSYHFPQATNPETSNASYMDSYPRSYYQPYDSANNPNGYNGSTERRIREHQLLVNAVQWINQNHPVPADLNIDADGDGYVDNVCFMIKGNAGAWADLLWAHRWALYTYDVYINGKRVWDYTFQPENQVSVRTLSHELFHVLGAPDLYHYYNYTNIKPAGKWDIMNSGSGHMLNYMKWKYSEQYWISDIPTITTSGLYTILPSTSPVNNCYKIPSPNSSTEYFVVEYRKFSGEFESLLPNQGLIVYRINTLFTGNAQYDGTSIFDEVYVYRPDGTLTANGSPDDANYSVSAWRTAINDATNPSCFLSQGGAGGIHIFDISDLADSMSFKVSFGSQGQLVVVAEPQEGGNPTGAGTYSLGETVQLVSNPNVGYQFVAWVKPSGIFLGLSQILNYSISQPLDTVKAVYRQVVSVENLEDGNRVYPNPVKEKIYFSQPLVSGSVEIFSVDGRRYVSTNISGTEQELNVEQLPDGVYIIRWIGEGNIPKQSRIVKTK